MSPLRLSAVAVALAGMLPLTPLHAVTVVWDGAGPTAAWSAIDAKPGPGFGRTNWSGKNVFPDIGDDLVFDGGVRLSTSNDMAALTSIGNLGFAAGAGAFTLGGNALAIGGTVVNSSKQRQTIELAVSVTGNDRTWDGGEAGIAFDGGFALGDHTLTLQRRIAIAGNSSALVVGARADGALTIAGGSTVDVEQATVGQQRGSFGRLTVSGAGSRLSAPTALAVGQSASGYLEVSGGATVTTGGLAGGGQGPFAGTATIAVTGTGSSLTAGSVMLGGSGVAMVDIGAGASVASRNVSLETIRSRIRVRGGGTSWQNAETLSIRQGGELSVENGATVASGSISIGSSGSADVTVSAGRLTTTGSLTLGGPGGSHLGIYAGALVESASATVSGPLTSAILSDSGSRWNAGSMLQIGETGGGPASVKIHAGATLSAAAISVGTNGVVNLAGGTLQTESLSIRGSFDWTAGTLQLTTVGSTVLGAPGMAWPDALTMVAGTTLQVTNQLVLGATTLRVQPGASVRAAQTTVGADGILELAGGTLETRTLGTAGRFDWTAGTLRLTAADGAALGSGALARVATIASGRRLEVAHDLRVDGGTLLVLDGGRASAGRLLLGGGSVVGLQPLDMADYGSVQGHGSISAPMHGGGTTVLRADGSLTLGELSRADGFAFDGRLEVGSAQVLLLAAGPATPGAAVTVGAGGQLASVNGLVLGAGRTLTFDGSASVLGRFVNDGTVGGSGGTLTFLNDVSGGGGFAGDIVFHAGYSPGHSPARVDFGGRDANFDASAMLTIELDGADPGSGHDQLANIDRLDFDGRLRLVFGASYAPAAGTQWKLLDFDTFAGSLAPDRIDVAGFDRRRLDTSKLAVDGTLAVTAVPEPAAWTMWLSALLLAARVRRGAFNARAASACCAARVARQGRTVRPH